MVSRFNLTVARGPWAMGAMEKTVTQRDYTQKTVSYQFRLEKYTVDWFDRSMGAGWRVSDSRH
eukprot:1332161-Amorphochlora_amoeboformis.AAC.1